MRAALRLAALFLLVGCASIDHSQTVAQPINQDLLAGVGDVVLRIERERALENAFGKADIFGRRTKEGHSEIRFAGVEPDGSIVMYRRDVDILTNETTMSRTPIATTTSQSRTSVSGTGTTVGNSTYVQGTASTSGSSTTIVPAEDFHVVVPFDTVSIRLDPGEKVLSVSGYVIEILGATKNSLRYRIVEQAQ
jgi:hypothetical protein